MRRHEQVWIEATKFPDEKIIEWPFLEGNDDALSHLSCL